MLAELPPIDVDTESLQAEAVELRRQLEQLGPVNALAIEEHDETMKRHDFLVAQRADLADAKASLLQAIKEIDATARELFLATFTQVRENFRTIFMSLFGGGECDLRLENPDAPLDCDIEIHASPRGKKTQRINLLSSGERALVALSLLFGIFLTKPSPFCLLDEVDAPLDDANVGRFVRMLNQFKSRTQFIVITHNPRTTTEAGDAVYGVTMQEPGVSSLVSVRMRGPSVEAEAGEAAEPEAEAAGAATLRPAADAADHPRHGDDRAHADARLRRLPRGSGHGASADGLRQRRRPPAGAARSRLGGDHSRRLLALPHRPHERLRHPRPGVAVWAAPAAVRAAGGDRPGGNGRSAGADGRAARKVASRARIPDRGDRAARRHVAAGGRRHGDRLPQGAPYRRKCGIFHQARRTPARVLRRHGLRSDVRRMGARSGPPALRVLAPGGDGDRVAPHPRPLRRARGGGAAEASRPDALLHPGGARRHPRHHRRALCRSRHPRRRRVHVRARGRLMLVVMTHDATREQVARVVQVIEEMGYQARPMPGAQRTSVGLVGNDGRVDGSRLEALAGVAEVIHVSKPYKQVSREWRQENTLVTIAPGVVFGGEEIPIIAGPCSVESEAQIVLAAQQVRDAGGAALRGGAYKPRSSPYAFQGLGRKGLELLALARRETGLPIVTEALDEEGAHLVAEVADCIQIGARNMQNYSLLRSVGRIGKPVLLKRGMSATITDLLMSAEYILAEGNGQVILCERGIRSFDPSTRNLFDLTAIPLVQKLSHLPMVADPSHGTGLRDKVLPMGRAAIAAGADGLLVEVHPDPERALSDGGQSLYPDQFARLVRELRTIADAIGRSVAPAPGGAVGTAGAFRG
ncbi:MAG: 3-deoxy-7-phosphoheptulonate synthase [Gemmatimonadaceae bacterium]|nr:3-deoxy-7-phosphoheptulonate synthase [Gemmatimonadaceae bacterium]